MEIQEQNGMSRTENRIPEPVSFQKEQSPDNMATASLVMGILGLVTCCCYYGAFVFGGLGILFALLSRTEEHFRGKAKTGLALSVAGIVLALLYGAGILLLLRSGDAGSASGPIQNLPVMPDITAPIPDNIVTILGSVLTGGEFR